MIGPFFKAIVAIVAIVGDALQAATASSNSILVARVISGITPVLVSEMSSADHRGDFLGYVSIASYLGISFATG